MQLARTCTSHVTANGVILMPKFVIEREIASAGKLPATELQAISQKSCGVLNVLGPQIQWAALPATGFIASISRRMRS